MQFRMTREARIKNAMAKLSQLPDREINEVSDFAEFLLSKLDNSSFAYQCFVTIFA